MSSDPKMVAQRYYDIFSSGKVQDLDEICAPDMVGHGGAGSNLTHLKLSIGSFLDGFPGLQAKITQLVCEDDLVSGWVKYEGTHGGTFAGVDGTGRNVKFGGWDLFRVENGRIVELSSSCDVFTLMNQIGALPTASPA